MALLTAFATEVAWLPPMMKAAAEQQSSIMMRTSASAKSAESAAIFIADCAGGLILVQGKKKHAHDMHVVHVRDSIH